MTFQKFSEKHLNRALHDSGELVNDICGFCEGQRQEFLFRQGKIGTNLETYLRIRPQTMVVMPFFTMIGSLRFSEREWYFEEIKELERRVCQVVGLQNDLLGLEKDLENGEVMNAVIISARNKAVGQKTDISHEHIEQICDLHNAWTSSTVEAWEVIQRSTKSELEETILGTGVLAFADTHLKWCVSSKRYQVKIQ